MKKAFSLFLSILLLTGCSNPTAEFTPSDTGAPTPAVPAGTPFTAPEYHSRFSAETTVHLSGSDITVNGGGETDSVFTSHDIIYYENRDSYPSGNSYGEGTDADKHDAAEAAAHTVVNITAPGAYRISGSLSAGQLRIDLGDDARSNPDAVVELILENADITCTVAPAILFLNTFECDEDRSIDSARPDVDTTSAGANLILEGENTVTGSYVARIYTDTPEAKKLWKQDGAIYSYSSMNVFGSGALTLNAANEGMDTELHLTINGGTITICSGNDGINTNADGVSVTTINGGNLTIHAGLGEEGDGIDSNGYLVINGGHVFATANPAADAGLDSDLGSYIHGGTVVATGSAMDWAESDSGQVTMNLQFAAPQNAGAGIALSLEDGTPVFSFETDSAHSRPFSGMILSCPAFAEGNAYSLFVDGIRMAYTGTDTGRRPGGMPPGGFGEGMPPKDFGPGAFPGSPNPSHPDDGAPPPQGEHRTPPGGFGGQPTEGVSGEKDFRFFMNDRVNFFSGITAA